MVIVISCNYQNTMFHFSSTSLGHTILASQAIGLLLRLSHQVTSSIALHWYDGQWHFRILDFLFCQLTSQMKDSPLKRWTTALDSCDCAHQHKNLPQYSSRWFGLGKAPSSLLFKAWRTIQLSLWQLRSSSIVSYQRPPQAFLAVLPFYAKRPLNLQNWKINVL